MMNGVVVGESLRFDVEAVETPHPKRAKRL
jgi:hypothetical protein